MTFSLFLQSHVQARFCTSSPFSSSLKSHFSQPKALVLILAACFFAPSVLAQIAVQTPTSNSDNDNQTVVVTGSRFANSPDLAPIGATVITAADIRNAGMTNVNEAIRKLAGIYGSQNAYGTDDFALDMNGFGADSQNNLVVMIDGIRLSENEQTTALMSSIPIESVARIEIIKSGSSVLYGDGATGGVIQIITKQIGVTPIKGTIYAEVGQFKDRVGRVSLLQGGQGFTASLNLSDARTDNYRVNNDVVQKNGSLGLTWFGAAWRFGVRADLARQDSGLAGALSLAQFNQDPKQSNTPFDSGAINTDRYSAFYEQNWGAWQVAAEVSTRKKTAKAHYHNYGDSSYVGRQTQFTPRLRNLTINGNVTNEFVMGVDLGNWNRQTYASYSSDYATQKSRAIYVRDEIKIDQTRLALGARRELFSKSSLDLLGGGKYDVIQGVNAWEGQVSHYFASQFNVFAKVGQSYRVGNVDDNAFNPVLNSILLPQLSHDVEIGSIWGDAKQNLTTRLFQHSLTNEIYYNPVIWSNVNLDPTRRRGFAIEGKWQVSKDTQFSAQYQHVNAIFTSGAYSGDELVLVPKNTLSAQIMWALGDGRSAYVGSQWVDTQRYGSDFLNSCSALIPSHVTFDARFAQTYGAWEWSISGTNLADKKYFTNAYSCQGGIYPENGRQLKTSLRYSF